MTPTATGSAGPTPDGRADRLTSARSFGPAASRYNEARPTYPDAAVRWALEPLGAGGFKVADIGAGTGKMSRVVASLGHQVLAIEPDEEMRAILIATSPTVQAVSGAAESLPVSDGALDAAIAAQSYHWFDQEPAHAELARAIRPGGVFAAVWNVRDETVPWVAAYTTIIEGDRISDSAENSAASSFGEAFEPIEKASFTHKVRYTPQSLVTLLTSRSYYLTASPQRQAELTEQVQALTREHPDLVGRDGFALPYQTRVFRAVRRR